MHKVSTRDEGSADPASSSSGVASAPAASASTSRAAPGELAYAFGPFAISKVQDAGKHVGWGCSCRRHQDDPTDTTKCQKNMRFRGMSVEDAELAVREWALVGADIPNELLSRSKHLAIKPYELVCRSRAEQDIVATRLK